MMQTYSCQKTMNKMLSRSQDSGGRKHGGSEVQPARPAECALGRWHCDIPILPDCPSGQRCLEGGTEARPGAGLGLWAGLLVVRTRAEWNPGRLLRLA